MKALVNKLEETKTLSKDELSFLLNHITPEIGEFLFEKARNVAQKQFVNRIYIRGLIELTNYCKNDCYYCGIRCSNQNVERYRLTLDEILSCCKIGYPLGFRTFVLQGGEDSYYTDEIVVEIIKAIKDRYPDCAVTLSLGEKRRESYLKYYQAGADRYLLRHETANAVHFSNLHPLYQTLNTRMECLIHLKDIGYQTGTGFMVGSPYQTTDNLIEDLLFIKEFQPEMIGIGPFIPHHDTPFANHPSGSIDLTLFLISILRLMLPNVLIPSTTALGTMESTGREKGILAGANVVMPNLSPINVRKKYSLYDNKICTGEETAEGFLILKKQIEKIGYQIAIDRGDFRPLNESM